VVWATLDAPVLSKADQGGTGLVVGEPAALLFVTRARRQAGELIGLLKSDVVRSHHIRYGAATEIDQLGAQVTGGAEAAVARSLGHNKRSIAAEVTSRYIGPSTVDTLAARVNKGPGLNPGGGLEYSVGGVRYTVPQLSSAAITAKVEELGLDPGRPADRKRASRLLNHHKAWAADHRAHLDTPQPLPSSDPTPVATTDSKWVLGGHGCRVPAATEARRFQIGRLV
jgi:hypothetical protein